ncbi:hypothetical protein KI387_044459, partial [Taxus chinensis]
MIEANSPISSANKKMQKEPPTMMVSPLMVIKEALRTTPNQDTLHIAVEGVKYQLSSKISLPGPINVVQQLNKVPPNVSLSDLLGILEKKEFLQEALKSNDNPTITGKEKEH